MTAPQDPKAQPPVPQPETAASAPASASAPAPAPAPDPAATRRTLVERAARAWTDQLIDLSGRNGLLYYRDLSVGTLDLGIADPAAVAQLLLGTKTRLSALYPDPDVLKDASRRCRKIRDKARENLEERGVFTLFLASAMATWTQPAGQAAVPQAPVVLNHLALAPTGAAGEDFELTLASAPEINPTLFYALEAQFGVTADLDAIRDEITADEDDVATDTAQMVAAVVRAAAGVPGFKVDSKHVIGNFSYLKLPMVVDLAAHVDALEAHDMVAAIAGDAAAQQLVRGRKQSVDARSLDGLMPSAEFLVLDADGSQQAAIESIVRGSDSVIQGPPGTGKSQTISNLIAACAAKGLRVLFVAEKRAAIDAVIGRLDRVGLSDLVLDLHGGVASRRRLAENLDQALAAARGAMPTDATALQASLASRRELLAVHDVAVNAVRDPWGISLYAAQGRAADASAPALATRLAPASVDGITDAHLAELQEELRAYMALGGTRLRPEANPWAWAGPVDPSAIEGLSDTTMDLGRDALPALRAKAAAAASAAGIALPSTVAGIGTMAGTLAARERQAAVLDDAVFARASVLSPALEPARQGGIGAFFAGIFNGTYKSALAEARGLVKEPSVSPRRAADMVAEASATAASWATLDPAHPAPRVPGALELEAAWDRASSLVATLGATVKAPSPDATPDALAAWVAALETDLPTLRKLPEMRTRQAALAAAGLDEAVREIAASGLDADAAHRALDRAWAAAVVERIVARDPAVGGIDAERLDGETASYRQLDKEHIGLTAARVKRAWAERAVRARDAYPEQDMVLAAEARKKSRHLSVRELFTRTPDVLTAVKPCWAMSPLLVSQILPGDKQYFDLVIFDEASQILPADAIPSLMRGKRAVVAGDGLQLPPTTFFASQTTTDREAAGEPLEGEGDALISGFASLLDVADSLVRSDPLRWHYRSRDERLIAFSNLHIYTPAHRELTTFPAVEDDACVRHVQVAPRADGSDGVSSEEEVQAVIDLVFDHARTRPKETLGVIAMGIQHAERINEALRLRRASAPELDGFFAEDGREPFFVKNLERVQGDERDAIILTIGYGRTTDGRLRQNFGPLNQQGGERRLNVAITRSKRRVTVVSSFGSDDIDPTRTTAEGVRLMQAYIRYAESGGLDLGNVVPARPALNGFEQGVLAALHGMGVTVVPQLGTSAYALDFALQHPTKAGRFVLAVECDGASYHSAPTVRERDRLRQQQLELIGWKFHRVWSTDWYRDRAAEILRLKVAYDAAVAAYDAAVAKVAAEKAAQAAAAEAARAAADAQAAEAAGATAASQGAASQGAATRAASQAAADLAVPAPPVSDVARSTPPAASGGATAVASAAPAPTPDASSPWTSWVPQTASPVQGAPSPQAQAPAPAPAPVTPAAQAPAPPTGDAPASAQRGPKPKIGRHSGIDQVPPAQLDALVRWIESDHLLRTEDELVAEVMAELGFNRKGTKITAAIEASIARVRGGGGAGTVAPPPPPDTRGPRPRVRRADSIDKVSFYELDRLVLWTLSDPQPKTEDELLAEVTGYLGFKRRGPRIDDAIRQSVWRLKGRKRW
jgi:very-short-patch-repair endonuclease